MKKQYLIIILVLSVAGLAAFWTKGPIPQDLAYHQFADQRQLLGIPHFWNVMSNLPMFFLGLWGFYIAFRQFSARPDFASKWIPIVLVSGVFVTSFGSAYYHLAPDNKTLVWDRLPMTLMFMPVFSLVIYDFIGAIWGRWAFLLSVPLGIFSIWYWSYTESIGQGDLRLYALVQFYPMLVAPAIILLSAKKTAYAHYFWLVLGWYVVAKLFELNDKQTFDALGFWSGHTVKHLVGAVSLYYLLKLLQEWQKGLRPPAISHSKQM